MNPLLRDELAAIISESAPSPIWPASADVLPAPLDASPRARKMRAILRIADSRGWRTAITHFLDLEGVSHMTELTPLQLDDLLERMNRYVDSAETGCSLADCPPAH